MTSTPTRHDRVLALAPRAEPLDPAWSLATLEQIIAVPAPARRRSRLRPVALGLAGGVVALTAGVAAAGIGPAGVVKDAIIDFSHQPNTSAQGLGRLHDPRLVARFQTGRGVFAVWVATSSTGKVCDAYTDGTWDGVGLPRRSDLTFGCNEPIVDPDDPDHAIELTRPDQIGGFFKDDLGPILYGVAPYPTATAVQVRGVGIDQTLPVRADSHGYGAAVPRAGDAASVDLTFLDATGRVLGSKHVVAPVG